PKNLVEAARDAKARSAPGFPENFVFREESREDRNAGDSQPACQHRRECDRHVLLQISHPSHVLLVMHSVNYRARTEKQEGLEEGMCDDMKDCRNKGADAASEKHVSELRDS